MFSKSAKGLPHVTVFLCVAMVRMPVFADESVPDQDGARIFTTPAERREAGLGRKVTDWLTVSGLLELETLNEKEKPRSAFPKNTSDEFSQAIQIGLDARLSQGFNIELLLDYEVDTDRFGMDVGALHLEAGEWSFSAGKLYVPFGEYYSHFVTGPMLEFGETRAYAVVAEYSFSETTDLFVYALESEVDKVGHSGNVPDWGLGIEWSSVNEMYKFGAGYISDLSESDASLLGDFDNVWQNHVGGWNAYLRMGMDSFEVTAETVVAAGRFSELDADKDKPWANNLEIAWFPVQGLQLAGRIGHSQDLEGEPEWQYGLSASWRVWKYVGISTDYVYSRFQDNFIFDKNDNELKSRHHVAAQLVIEF